MRNTASIGWGTKYKKRKVQMMAGEEVCDERLLWSSRLGAHLHGIWVADAFAQVLVGGIVGEPPELVLDSLRER